MTAAPVAIAVLCGVFQTVSRSGQGLGVVERRMFPRIKSEGRLVGEPVSNSPEHALSVMARTRMARVILRGRRAALSKRRGPWPRTRD